MDSNILTIIVPTHNRKKQLTKCLRNIQLVFPKCKVIVGDNSSIDYPLVTDALKYNPNAQLIDLRNPLYAWSNVYQILINNVNTPYTLIVEDDDVIVNPSLHQSIIQQLTNNNIISFSGLVWDKYILGANKFSQQITSNFNLCKNTFEDIPKFWNGCFQFGMMYFPTHIIQQAFTTWFDTKIERSYNFNSDEAIALLSISLTKKYKHIPTIGYMIGIGNDNLSWENDYFNVYSALTYIDDLAKILNMNNKWILTYYKIWMNELRDSISNFSYDLFNNIDILQISSNIKQMIIQKCTSSMIKEYIKNDMKKFIKKRETLVQINNS